jgi:hypothetical protein
VCIASQLSLDPVALAAVVPCVSERQSSIIFSARLNSPLGGFGLHASPGHHDVRDCHGVQAGETMAAKGKARGLTLETPELTASAGAPEENAALPPSVQDLFPGVGGKFGTVSFSIPHRAPVLVMAVPKTARCIAKCAPSRWIRHQNHQS